MPCFYRVSSKVVPVIVAVGVAIAVGPEILRAIAQASLLMAQISLELGQMGIPVRRVCGI